MITWVVQFTPIDTPVFGTHPHEAGVCIVGAAQAPLLVNTCHAVPVATAAGFPLASYVIRFQAVPLAILARVTASSTSPAVGSHVALVNTRALGVPRAGVTSVGEVANTKAPLHVSSVTALARLALDGVARKADTQVPRPVIEPTAGVTV